MRSRIHIGLIFLVAILGCKRDSTPIETVPKKSDSIMPLQVGNRWSLLITHFDTSGNAFGAGEFSYSIKGDTLINNERWFIGDSSGLSTVRADGLWIVLNGAPTLWLKYPVTRGETFDVGNGAFMFERVLVVSIDTIISVPYGSLSTIAYERRSPYGELFELCFYAVNIGLVRYDVFTRFHEREYVYYRAELTSFTLH